MTENDQNPHKLPTMHSMKRRSDQHDYFRTGYYHVTISAAAGQHQPFGRVTGRPDRPDGDDEAPRVELTAVGRMVQQELLTSITQHYEMLQVLEHVIMPEHLHFLLVARRNIVSKNGRPTHLGQVIAGFKYGCNRRYWAMTGRLALAAEPPGTVSPSPATATTAPTAPTRPAAPATPAAPSSPAAVAGGSVLGGSAAKVAAKLPPLFEAGYVDVMPVDEAQLATQRQYIRDNPRSRLLRMENRARLQVRRLAVDTAVTLPALYGYLRRESPWQMTADAGAMLERRLLTSGGRVVCDSYGAAELLTGRRLLPVVCHRKDRALFERQKARCLAAAAAGAVLVSAHIAAGEQAIMDEATAAGAAVILVVDNGFTEKYHASKEKMELCRTGRLLLLSPWKYEYRRAEEGITVPECKAMNCVAQALCRTRDDWWKTDRPGG